MTEAFAFLCWGWLCGALVAWGIGYRLGLRHGGLRGRVEMDQEWRAYYYGSGELPQRGTSGFKT